MAASWNAAPTTDELSARLMALRERHEDGVTARDPFFRAFALVAADWEALTASMPGFDPTDLAALTWDMFDEGRKPRGARAARIRAEFVARLALMWVEHDRAEVIPVVVLNLGRRPFVRLLDLPWRAPSVQHCRLCGARLAPETADTRRGHECAEAPSPGRARLPSWWVQGLGLDDLPALQLGELGSALVDARTQLIGDWALGARANLVQVQHAPNAFRTAHWVGSAIAPADAPDDAVKALRYAWHRYDPREVLPVLCFSAVDGTASLRIADLPWVTAAHPHCRRCGRRLGIGQVCQCRN